MAVRRYAPGLWEHFGLTVLTVVGVEFGFFAEACRFIERTEKARTEASKGSGGR